MTNKIFYLLFILIFPKFVLAAGFDCRTVATNIEQITCDSQGLMTLDDKLNNFYQLAKDSNGKDKILENWLINIYNDEFFFKKNYNEITSKFEYLLGDQIINEKEENISFDKTIITGEENFYDKNQEHSTFFERFLKNINELSIFSWSLVMLGPFVVWFWDTFLRRKCPSCRSTRFSFIQAKELDRWRQSVKVTESLSNGKSRERHVQKTYVKVQRDYKCDECQHRWSETHDEEK